MSWTSTPQALMQPMKTVLKFSAFFYIALQAILGVIRLWYPFELEWMEGHALEQVQRILAGQPLYVPPSLNFIPTLYAPLYYYLSALLAFFTSPSFIPLRLVSFASGLGIVALVYALVSRETGSRFSGLLAAGLFAGTYRISGAWLDIARVDSLYVFWLMLTLYLLRFSPTPAGWIWAAGTFALASLTKQTAVLFFLPLVFALWLRNRKQGLIFLAAAAGFMIASHGVLNGLHQGWFYFYVWALPAEHHLAFNGFFHFWQDQILYPLGFACGMIVLHLWDSWSDPESSGGDKFFYPLIGLGLLLLALTGRLNSGSYDNALLPLYAGLAVLFGLAVHHLTSAWQPSDAKHPQGWIYLFSLLQFLVLLYPPSRQLPTQADLDAGKNLLEVLKKIDGPILAFSHGYLPGRLGKPSFTHSITLSELTGLFSRQGTPAGDRILQALNHALERREFAAVLLDTQLPYLDLQRTLDANYILVGRVFTNPDVFWPVTGHRTRPEYLYMAQTSAALNPLLKAHPAMPQYLRPQPPLPATVLPPNRRILATAASDDEYAQCIHQGIAAATRQDLAQAKIWWQKALDLDPARPEAHANLGVLHEHQGEYTQALQCYRLAAQKLGEPWIEYYRQLHQRMGGDHHEF